MAQILPTNWFTQNAPPNSDQPFPVSAATGLPVGINTNPNSSAQTITTAPSPVTNNPVFGGDSAVGSFGSGTSSPTPGSDQGQYLQQLLASGVPIQQAITQFNAAYNLSPGEDGAAAYYPNNGTIGLSGQYLVAPTDGSNNWGVVTRSPESASAPASSASGGFTLDPSQFGQYLQPYQPFVPPTGVTAQNDPSYQFGLTQGEKAIQGSAAANGTLLTGATPEALDEFANNYATQQYQNVYNNALNTYDTNANTFYANETNPFSKLLNAAGVGASAVAGQNAAGSQFASNLGALGSLGTSATDTFGSQLGQNASTSAGLAGDSANLATGLGNSEANIVTAIGNANAGGSIATGNALSGIPAWLTNYLQANNLIANASLYAKNQGVSGF